MSDLRRYYEGFAVAVLIGLLTVFALWGVSRVPFHPDESTQLFTSQDFTTFLQNPLLMAWTPDQGQSEGPLDALRRHYHLVDAPLTRYLLGLGRTIAGLHALGADWDWSRTWEENRQAGALPDERLLYVGRITITLLLPLSLFFIYQVGKSASGVTGGLLTVLLLGINTLVLLHGRRAMAEGALILGVTIALWSFLWGDRRPWLAGLGMALAINAKQSNLGLLPVGLLAVVWSTIDRSRPPAKIATAILQYLGVFALLTFLLNPFLWRYPWRAFQASLIARQALSQQQVADALRLAPEKALLSPGMRAVALLANLYITLPSFAEVSNYLEQTAATEQAYMAVPGHNLLRGMAGGGVMLVTTLFGVIVACLRLLRRNATQIQTNSQVNPYGQKRTLTLLLLATICQAATLILFIPLPWQRYVIPLVPFTGLWSSYAIGLFLERKVRL
jgi:hypothetical protein